MKNMLVSLLVVSLVLGIAVSSQAKLITFDEAGIALGNKITDQYITDQVRWIPNLFQSVPLANQVTIGSSFGNSFSSDMQILYYNGGKSETTDPVEGTIQLGFDANTLSFEFRRPDESGQIRVKLFSGYNEGAGAPVEVYDSDIIVWNSGDGWKPFHYPGTSGPFDLIWMYSPSDQKFVIDNLEINPVPVPASIWLLASGLIPVVFRRRKS